MLVKKYYENYCCFLFRALQNVGVTTCPICFTLRERTSSALDNHLNKAHSIKLKDFISRFGHSGLEQTPAEVAATNKLSRLVCPSWDCHSAEVMDVYALSDHLSEGHDGIGYLSTKTTWLLGRVAEQISFGCCDSCELAVDAELMEHHAEVCWTQKAASADVLDCEFVRKQIAKKTGSGKVLERSGVLAPVEDKNMPETTREKSKAGQSKKASNKSNRPTELKEPKDCTMSSRIDSTDSDCEILPSPDDEVSTLSNGGSSEEENEEVVMDMSDDDSVVMIDSEQDENVTIQSQSQNSQGKKTYSSMLQSRYTCPECKMTDFVSLRDVMSHIDEVHSGDIKILESIKEFRKEVMTWCEICDAEVVSDEVELGSHVWIAHDLPLRSYLDMYAS